MEEKHFFTLKKASTYRKRYDSSMNFNQYVQTYGHIPQAPSLKPIVDPTDDLPIFELEEPTFDETEEQKDKGQDQFYFKLETIPEIQNSQNNSINFSSPNRNIGLFLERQATKKLKESEDKQLQNPRQMARRRRSQSESQDYQIITFLMDSCRGKKKIKKD